MKRKFFVIILFLINLLFYSCNNGKPSTIPPKDTDTGKYKDEGDFASEGINKSIPPLESFRKIVDTSHKVHLDGNEFYTEKNYGGERFFQSDWSVKPYYNVAEGIVIKSVKLLPGYQVSFDFGSDCNSIENGHFRYYNYSMPDIFANCGCDENFSKIMEIYVRKTPDKLGGIVQIWEKPYLLGKDKRLIAPTDSLGVKLYKWNDFGFPAASSIQLGKGLLVNLYRDENFSRLLVQINTAKAGIDKLYILSDIFTYAEFKSLSISRLD